MGSTYNIRSRKRVVNPDAGINMMRIMHENQCMSLARHNEPPSPVQA